MKFDIQIKGLEELRRRWATAPAKIKKMTMDALTRSGYLVEGASKRVTPVDTGRLRSSISLSSSLALRTEPHVVISPHTDYANFVHFGTRYMKARPFMTQGYEAVKSRIKSEMRSLLNNIVKELK